MEDKIQKTKLIQDTEISEILDCHYTGIAKKKKSNSFEYEIIRLGSICHKYNISIDKLELLLKDNNLEKVLKIINIIEEK
ncbi:MAG: hypothetical protein M0P91_04600 [Sulfuricurvum sp.]|jgi:hypothetical protein|uniref:hypothetical protein n=1 Tax=Sulfuricurvum sp. TaxID=2025608 RepID=UPI0025E386BE|nr:hypothetical protein [Sulfuricurvum sp.]MCK9372455.1 hypothetical protein [Sulfuricurvum sp.]